MKRVLLVALMIVAFSMTASAEGQIKPAIYAGGGVGMPMGPDFLKDYYKMGISFGGGVGFAIKPNLEVIGKVFFNNFGADKDKFAADGAPSGTEFGDWKVTEFGADLKYLFSTAPDAKFGPYVVGGIGMASSKTEITVDLGGFGTVSGSGSTTDLSFNGGAGFEYGMSPTISIWVDGRLVYVATEGDATLFVPIRAGLKVMFGGGNGEN